MNRNAFSPPLKPRDGRVLRVVKVSRISTEHQDIRSLDDQDVLCEQHIASGYAGKIEWHRIASRGSGEYLDTAELSELSELIESRHYDVVVAEDLGRICRRIAAVVICEQCEDHGVRLIAINDHLDTAQPDWTMNAFFAAIRAQGYNADTAKRIRRSQRNRFANGGMVQYRIFGYLCPAGANHEDQITKDPAWEAYAIGIVVRLEAGWTYSQVADWLNENGVPTGPRARRKTWNRKLVAQWIHNSAISGWREWNHRISIRVNKSGRRKKVKADPSELMRREVPHWAFIDVERHHKLLADIKKRNSRFGVPKKGGVDPRKDRPKKSTRWPGQHIVCGICNRPYVFGGHGRTTFMMCSGAKDYKCWNGTAFDAEMAARNIASSLWKRIQGLQEFDPSILALIRQEAVDYGSEWQQRIDSLDRQIGALSAQVSNLVKAIANRAESGALLEALDSREAELKSVTEQRRQLQAIGPGELQLPSIEQVRLDAAAVFRDLAVTSPEFGIYMRRMIPRIVARPVIPCVGGFPVVRASVDVDLSTYLKRETQHAEITQQLRFNLTVDCFVMPHRLQYLGSVANAKARGLTFRQIAEEIQTSFSTVQLSGKVLARMAKAGLSDPYVAITDPDQLPPRMKRHRHSRYRFEPLPPE